ncbi:hypothetical protein GCK72_015005 [Caenorhabditis remanei]|uniref:Uncharacterized protein n=1 Tax=Caenorhabditis remanei TaxID=31234 RepID=A0A6A5GVA7_CAERE|nr:hypothetical protein GCK72_015005 [Caenorhabditis remanei]KAF1758546.1 hypothetical protein GCK72_015005 [Caenorhabditis remanei]
MQYNVYLGEIGLGGLGGGVILEEIAREERSFEERLSNEGAERLLEKIGLGNLKIELGKKKTYAKLTGVAGPLVLLFEDNKFATALPRAAAFVDFNVVIPLISENDPSADSYVDNRIVAFDGRRDLVFPKFSSTYLR